MKSVLLSALMLRQCRVLSLEAVTGFVAVQAVNWLCPWNDSDGESVLGI